MDDMITAALAPIFANVTTNSEVADFYQEVAADLKESAQVKLMQDSALTERMAVQLALAEMGDLAGVVQLLAAAGDEQQFAQLPVLQTLKQIQQLFDPNVIHHVRVQAKGAKIQFVQSVTADISVTYNQRGFFKGGLAMVQRDDVLELNLPVMQPWANLVPFKHPRQTLVIGVPEQFLGQVTLNTHNGVAEFDHLVVPNLAVDVNNKAGNLVLNDIAVAKVALRTKSGNIKVTASNSNSWQADINAGNLTVVDTNGHFDVRVLTGNAKLKQVLGAGDFTVESGNLMVDWRGLQGNVTFNMQNGNIKNTVPLDTAFAFDLQSQNGVVKVTRPASYDVETVSYAKGRTAIDAVYQITAKSRGGNLHFR